MGMNDRDFVYPPQSYFQGGGRSPFAKTAAPQKAPAVQAATGGGMGDLPEAIRYRTQRKEAVGPLNAPMDIREDCLQYLCYLMELMLKRFAWYPRNTLSFIAPSLGPIVVPAGGTANIATFQMPQDKQGVLMYVGWDCSPPASFGLVTWTLFINGAAHPFFNNLTFATSNLANADQFVVPLGMNATVELRASNFNLGPVTLNGTMRGFVLIQKDPGIYSGL